MKTNLLQTGTQGVDMKSNPLTLGNKKLHAATNFVFEEGVMRTRFGIDYKSLGAEGLFQGACEYRPKEGLSASVLSDVDHGIVVVVGGILWFNCNPITTDIFDCSGSVHLYQAENYLILQNPSTDTYWWDGVNDLTQSPGMSEQDWKDPEVPLNYPEIVAPEADLSGCGPGGGGGGGTDTEDNFLLVFTVFDKDTSALLEAAVALTNDADFSISGETELETGRWSTRVAAGTYTYTISKTCYTTVTGTVVVVGDTEVVEGMADSCTECSWTLSAASVDGVTEGGGGGGGDTTVNVHLTFPFYGEDFYVEEEDIVMTGSVAGGFTGTCSRGDLTLQYGEFPTAVGVETYWYLSFDSPTTPIPSTPQTAGPYMVECYSQFATVDDPSDGYTEHRGAPYPHWLALVTLSEE